MSTGSVPARDSLIARFHRSATRFPDRDAIVEGDRVVSYAEAANTARRWAGMLHALLGHPPQRVGVFAQRNAFALQAILAAQTAGAAYVPLQPGFPPARLRSMLQSAELDALIVEEASQEILQLTLQGLNAPPPVLCPPPAAEESSVAPLTELSVGPDDTAYLLFTSGSTGTPKGVPIQHRSALHFVDVNQERYAFGPEDRFSQASALTFDLSVFDLFSAWNVGACVCLLRPIEMFAPARFVERHGLTVWFSVPSVVSTLRKKDLLRPGSMPSLRWSLFCGEALPVDSAQAWQEAAPGSTLENLYGPTEATVACLVYRWHATLSPAQCLHGTVPIGSPYPGLDAIAVDEELAAVPEGHEGELCVGGPQVFDGYWRAPERDAEALFEREHDGRRVRFYRTGDRVRRQPGGEYVYLGRLDHQLKVQGHRVELGEVEAALRTVPGVVEAVAVGWPRSGYSVEAITAFVTGSELYGPAVASASAERLPRHAVPRTVHVVERLPLNANGKFDRKELLRKLAEAPEGP